MWTKLILWAVTFCTALASSAFAQSPVGRIASYICWSYPTDIGYGYDCAIDIEDLTAGSTSWIPSAIQPVWSPDGSKIAYQSNLVGGTHVMTLSDSTVVTLPEAASFPWFEVPDGSPLLQRPAWSPDSSRIAIQTSADRQLYVMSADGAITNRLTSAIQIDPGRIVWSPDGRRIAFNCEIETGNRDICVVDADGINLVRLTDDPGSDTNAIFSPDGRSLAFVTTRFGPDSEIALMNADGSGVRHIGAGIRGFWPVWSPDGGRIAFTALSRGVSVVRVDGSNLQAVGPGEFPVWSPDGEWIASTVPGGGACPADGQLCWFDNVGIMAADGTGIFRLRGGREPDWTVSRRPVASPDQTRLPPASQIVDDTGGVWTIDDIRILKNGQDTGGLGTIITWCGGQIHVLGTDYYWWRWTGGWLRIGPSDPCGGAPPPPASTSPDQTRLPPSGQIVDDTGAVWTIDGLRILKNGQDTGGLGTVITWCGGRIHVLGTDNYWWRWNGEWVRIGPVDPCGS